MYLVGPDGLVNQGYPYFKKLIWMTLVHVLRPRKINDQPVCWSQIVSVEQFLKICGPLCNMYIGFYGKPNVKEICF